MPPEDTHSTPWIAEHCGRHPLLRAALEYAKRGWPVFPCRPREKRPLTAHGFKDGTTDERRIIKWWTRWPGANVAIVTGAPSGLIALDVDPRSGGDDSLAELLSEHGGLPDTVESLTGGDGRHILFTHPGSRVPCSRIAPGVEVKADGGYIVAPPSVHPSGREYAWEASSRPNEVEVAPCPTWLLSRICAPDAPSARVDAASTRIGKAFAQLDMLGRELADGKRTVICPWQEKHTTGADYDSSTVIFPARQGKGLGGFDCKHQHCRGRTAREVLAALGRLARGESMDPEPWVKELRINGKGALLNSFANLVAILRHDPEFAGRLRFNEMSVEYLYEDAAVDDAMISHFRVLIEKLHHIQPKDSECAKAVHLVASERSFHPVRDYLNKLVWDGTPRLLRVASEILHVKAADPEENGLYELLVLRWFIALAARPLQPGCKVDTALILQGEQGAGKSTFFRELGGDFFGDSEMPLDKDAYLMLRGTWLHEWAELENVLGRHEVSKVKAFLSSTTDRYRPPYGRTTATIPRSAIIVGTTNKEEFLHDPTGSRRFWCIAVGTIDLARLAGWREQLLAEAVSRFRAGERWWLSKEEEAERARVAARFTETDPWEDAVLAYADRQTETTLHEILCDVLDIALARMDRRAQIRVANILRRHGYFPRQRRVDGRRGRYWSRKGGG